MAHSPAAYRAEAMGEPFTLWLDGGSLRIRRPSGDRLMALVGAESTLDVLRLLAGDDSDALLEALQDEDAAVTLFVLEDLRDFFGAKDVPRLSWLLERYGEAIERDLSLYHGVDLLDLWRGNITPRKLLAYIDYLPSYSAFIEASAQDDEVAEMFASMEQTGPVSPRITEWTPERAELVKVNEAIRALTALVHNALGGNGDAPKPEPRPETAADRLAAKVEEASYQYLTEKIAEAQTA